MSAGTPARVVVIGVGNTWRHDDAAGHAVAAAVRAHLDVRLAASSRASDEPAIEVVELDGEAARLVETWDRADLAVVIDAMRSGAAPGTIHPYEIDVDPGGPPGLLRWRLATGTADRAGAAVPGGHTDAGKGTSSHGLGVGQAVLLAQALDRLPRRLVVVGIEAADLRRGTGLSARVAAAVAPAARLVVDLVHRQWSSAGPSAPHGAVGDVATADGAVADNDRAADHRPAQLVERPVPEVHMQPEVPV